MNKPEKPVQPIKYAADLQDLYGVQQMRIVDLEQLLLGWWFCPTIERALDEAADAVDTASALFHGRGRPTNPVVKYTAAEGVEILAFLQDVGRDEDKGEARHAELLDQTPVYGSRHGADRHLPLECSGEQGRDLGQRQAMGIGEVDGEQEIEGARRLRHFVERMDARLLGLSFQEGNEFLREIMVSQCTALCSCGMLRRL
jgi:hypothetical protein